MYATSKAVILSFESIIVAISMLNIIIHLSEVNGLLLYSKCIQRLALLE